MPTVPSVQSSRPQTRGIAIAPSSARIRAPRPIRGPDFVTGANIGAQAVRSFGRTVQRAGLSIADTVVKAQEESRKRAAQTLLLAEQSALDNFSMDLQNDIYGRRGQNAFGSPNEFSQKYDKYVQDRLDLIPDEDAKFMFAQVAASRRNRALTQVYGHERKQMDLFTQDTIKASIETSKRRAVMNFNNPEIIDLSIKSGKESILAGARMNGIPDISVQNELDNFERDLNLAIAQKQILEDPNSFSPENFSTLPPDDLLDLQTEAFTLQERKQKDVEEQTAADLHKKRQDGTLQITDVEANRSNLDYKEYITLRQMALSEDPVTNGAVYADLLSRSAKGEDITNELEAARFTQKTLSNDDYMNLLDRTNKVDTGIDDPVESGRIYALDSVGASAKELGIGQSRTLARVRFDYDLAIENFVKDKGRQPNIAEAKEIADRIVTTYDALSLDEISVTLPKPVFMTQQEKITFGKTNNPQKLEKNRAIIQRIKKQTTEDFLKRYNGNREALIQDDDYLEEMQRIQSFEKILGDK